jgi:hypothetical protein
MAFRPRRIARWVALQVAAGFLATLGAAILYAIATGHLFP